jgi:hypothetical protein
MRKPWTVCPECGCGKGEDHKRGCLRRKAGMIMDYSRVPRNRGAERMRAPAPAPMQPLTEPETRRATSVVKPHA